MRKRQQRESGKYEKRKEECVRRGGINNVTGKCSGRECKKIFVG